MLCVYMRRTTVFLPDELHEQLRQEAFRKRISMASLIRKRLETLPPSKHLRHEIDPLLKVTGICRGPVLSDSIDEELYDI